MARLSAVRRHVLFSRMITGEGAGGVGQAAFQTWLISASSLNWMLRTEYIVLYPLPLHLSAEALPPRVAVCGDWTFEETS